MPWVKVPPEHHPIFHEALPRDSCVETMKRFGGVAAKVNGHIFAGLFGRSTMVLLNETDRAEALKLEGASLFDPMGDGRARSDKVMLPEALMADAKELLRWTTRAFEFAAALPPKAAPDKRRTGARKSPSQQTAEKKAPAKKPAKKKTISAKKTR